jgi:hypothetical protein
MKKFFIIVGEHSPTKLSTRALCELKKQAAKLLANIQSPEFAQQMDKIKAYNPNAYANLILAIEPTKKALKQLLGDKKAHKVSAQRKAVVAQAEEFLAQVIDAYIDAVEAQRQAELATIKSGQLCKFVYTKTTGEQTTRIGTTTRLAKDASRKQQGTVYQGNIPPPEKINYIEFEHTENGQYKVNHFKSFIENAFARLEPLFKSERTAIMRQFPQYFQPQQQVAFSDYSPQPNSQQLEPAAKYG